MAVPVFEKGHYHWHLQTIKRSLGYAMTAACAYRTGTVIVDQRTGTKHDYRARDGVFYTQLVFPTGAVVPATFTDSEAIWNEQERVEKRWDSAVGREVNIGLPHQLSREGHIRIGLRMAQAIADRYNVVCEIAFHLPSNKPGHDQRNVHVHILFSSRELTIDGFGEKILCLDKKPYSSAEVKFLRKTWETIANEELEREGIPVRIDCRSLKDQGITDRLPQIHEGVKVRAMLDRNVDPAEIKKLQRAKATAAVQPTDNVVPFEPKDDDRKKTRIDYDKLDEGRNRHEFNVGEIIALNERRALYGPLPLVVQILYLTKLIEALLEKITDLEALIPRNLLPEWVRLKVERAWRRAAAIMAKWQQEKEEAEQEREKREGIHARIRRWKEEMKRLDQERAHKQALLRLYMRIEAHVNMRPPIRIAAPRPPPRELTNHQFNQELKLKAEAARARVPPEFRPRLPVKDVVWDVHDQRTDKLSHNFQNVVPIDNGGRARPPPAMTHTLNRLAAGEPQTYKTKANIRFGLSS